MDGRRTWCAAAVVAAVALLGAACAKQNDQSSAAEVATEAEQQPRQGGRLVYAIEADPNGMDPARNAFDYSGLMVANAVFDTLTAIDAEGVARPYLAESMTANPDFTTWTITLRPNVRFSNGVPLDGEALAGYLRSLKAEGAVTARSAVNWSEIRVTGPRTVEIHTTKSWASLPVLLAGQPGYVVAPETTANPTAAATRPIGTGPFKVDRWDIGSKVQLVRNENYWRSGEGLPRLDAVEFRVVADGHQRVELLSQGEADIISASDDWDVNDVEAAVARRPDRLRVTTDPGESEKSGLVFNTQNPLLKDRRVRQAIAYATDVKALAAEFGWSPDQMALGPFDQGSRYHEPVQAPTADPARARALLQEYLGDPRVANKPKNGRIAVKLTGASGEIFLQRLVEQWAKVGIDAELNVVDTKSVARLAVMGAFELLYGRNFSAFDPDLIWRFLHKDMVPPLTLNFARFVNDALSKAMDDGRATDDPVLRKDAYSRAQHILAEEVPYLWLRKNRWRIATSARVRDARNVSLPDGRAAMPFLAGTHRLAETWVAV